MPLQRNEGLGTAKGDKSEHAVAWPPGGNVPRRTNLPCTLHVGTGTTVPRRADTAAMRNHTPPVARDTAFSPQGKCKIPRLCDILYNFGQLESRKREPWGCSTHPGFYSVQ